MSTATEVALPTYPDLDLLLGSLVIWQLPASAPFPTLNAPAALRAVVRTADELSVISAEQDLPPGVPAERGWRALRVRESHGLEVPGVTAAVVTPLADAEIAVFVVATFATDHVLLKEDTIARAVEVLSTRGFQVHVA